MGTKKLISVVSAVWNEEENVKYCYHAVKQVFDEHLPSYEYEHIFCDNCSTDRTLDLLKEIANKDTRVKIIANSRNFGAARSAFNGLMAAKGDAVIFAISADLQDPPALIPEFVKKWEEGFQVVYGIRTARQESAFRSLSRKVYYRAIQKFADFHIPTDVGDFQLLDKVVVEALRRTEDYYPYTRGMIAQAGFKSVGLKYTHLKRERGIAKGNIWVLIDLGLNGLVSFTNVPLRLCMLAGVIVSCLGFLFILLQFLMLLFPSTRALPLGISTLIAALFFLSGLQLFFLGLLGEYVSATHFQVRKRPLVIEKERINFDRNDPPSA